MLTPIEIPTAEKPKSKRSNARIAQKNLVVRGQLWPDVKDKDLWLRTKNVGFTTIPRTMPLIAQIMDGLSNGKPVFSTYYDLWCRAFDECFVTLNKKQEMAFHAGYTGQRGEQTWKARMQILSDLGFIRIKEGPFGPLSYVLILNPHIVIESHHKKKTPGFNEALYNALVVRSVEIGSKDIAT